VPSVPELRISLCQWLVRQVLVRDNNVDQALMVLKKKMQREGVGNQARAWSCR